MIDISVYGDTENSSIEHKAILKHIGLVRRVALHLRARIPNYMEVDELIQVGTIGLIEATKNFDASKGVDFELFAKTRIRGAIIDQVRKLSYLPRSAMVTIREHNEASATLSSTLGREPSHSELADFMGKDIESFQKERNHAHRFQTVSIESQLPEVSDIPSTLGTLADDPEAKLSKEQLMAAVACAIAQLPEREKTIVSLYYVEEMNLKEIGSILGVSESRISQLLSLTVKQLRAVLTHQD